ncbi:DUF5462 family protein [Providencia rettgeri]|uniref:DUF5462 family protein n=1 Tax=Providencia rettgeri TaxID=587 RepID=A0AAE2ZGD1_PRORE|nr:DUF5462 family protein [Providencia rettgeri]MBW3117518.1 DUF5462 family protein [Providencia rettgeri]NHN51113.1 DUF5462 family protein [Providencia rettgeri]
MKPTHGQSAKKRGYPRRWATWAVLLSLSLSASALARQQVEALGVVNGQVSARTPWVEVTTFLSGQPLFTMTDGALSPTALWVEQATLVSQTGEVVRLQLPLTLSAGGQGMLQLPVTVRVNNQVVRVRAEETSLGVRLSLPAREDTTARVDVTLVPAGAVQLTVPAAYRGDVSVALRVTSDTAVETSSSSESASLP